MNTDKSVELFHSGVTDRILGAFYEVYNELGYGFLESIYEAALLRVLTESGLRIRRQSPVAVQFRGQNIGTFRIDLVVEDLVVVETKAVAALAKVHEMQLVNYLKITGYRVGLLLNFGPKPEFRRRVFGD